MSGTGGSVTVPAVGPVNKKVLFAIVGVSGAFIAWRYYQARSGTGTATNDSTDTGLVDAEGNPIADDGSILPAVADSLGNVWGSNPTGTSDTGGDVTVDSYGFNGTSDSQWTAYVANALANDGTYSYTAIAVALGNYLGQRPLTTDQQSIVRAAIALAGYPPQHPTLPIVPGATTNPGTGTTTGAAPATPSAPRVDTITSHDAHAVTNAVSGATSYVWTLNGVHHTSAIPRYQFVGLKAKASYHLYVSAVNAAGKHSGASPTTAFKTK